MEDEIEDDTLAVPVPGLAAGGGSAAGYGDELRGLRKDMAAAQEQAARLRKQQLDAATAALRARRMGPSTAEQLFALSAAFAQPRRTRGGAFAATMSNVMPVLGQMAAAKRTGETSREDQLRALQDAYATGEVEGTQQSLTSRLNLLKAEMAANKPRSVYSANPVTGEMYSRDSGRPVPGPSHIRLLLTNPDKAAEFDLKFGPGSAEEILGSYGSARGGQGGQTGTPPSGGFRP